MFHHSTICDFSFLRDQVKDTDRDQRQVGLDVRGQVKPMSLLFCDNVKSARELTRYLPERLTLSGILGYGLDDPTPVTACTRRLAAVGALKFSSACSLEAFG